MDGTEWKTDSSEALNLASASGSGLSAKPKRRTLVERELETSLTPKITLPSPITDGGPNTSRYGRSRRVKTDSEFCDTDEAVSKLLKDKNDTSTKAIVYKMYASNSPNRLDNVAKPNNDSEKMENIIDLTDYDVEINAIFVSKDLIQKAETALDTNTFSAKKTNSHLKNILERSSEKYSLDTEIQAEKAQNSSLTKTSDRKTVTKPANSTAKTSSVVKTLDFDSDKMKKPEERKLSMTKSELFALEAKCAYQVGDLAWARVGTYPFWPCIVTREPFSELFVKSKLFSRTERHIVHVTFFADNGRRGWIIDNMLRKYTGIQEFEETRDQFTPEAKKKDPRLYAAFFVSDKKKHVWNLSVEEAETFLREPKRLRIDKLKDMLSSNKNVKIVKKPKSIKEARTDSDVSLSESLFDTLFSEDDLKIEDADTRSRKKSLDVSEVVTACLDNMAAKTGISMIQKQSHMDRWLQKAKSKTPEKPAMTPVKRQSLSLKKNKSLAKERTPKNKESRNKSLKAYQVEHDYNKFDIENENPVSNSNQLAPDNNLDYREPINGIRVENNVLTNAVRPDYIIETSIVDEVIDSEDNDPIDVKETQKDKTDVEKMDVDECKEKSFKALEPDEPLRLDSDSKSENNIIKSDISLVAEINTKENISTISDIKNVSDELSEGYSPDISFEESRKIEISKLKGVNKPEANICEIASSSFVDKTMEEQNSSIDSYLHTTSSINKVVLEHNEISDSSKSKENPNLSSSDTSKPTEPKTIIIKTPESLNQSIPASKEISQTDNELTKVTLKETKSKSKAKVKTQNHVISKSVVYRESRPKRKSARHSIKKGGSDDPEFLVYLELHQDAIMEENPELNQEELVKYLYKTWTYERDIKSDLLKDDVDDDVMEIVNVSVSKETKFVENVNEEIQNPVIICIDDDSLEATETQKPKENESVLNNAFATVDKDTEKGEDSHCKGDSESMTVQKTVLEKYDTELIRSEKRKLKISLRRENLEEKLIKSKVPQQATSNKSSKEEAVTNKVNMPVHEVDIKVVLQRDNLEEKLIIQNSKDFQPKPTIVKTYDDVIEIKADNEMQDLTITNAVKQPDIIVIDEVTLHKAKTDKTDELSSSLDNTKELSPSLNKVNNAHVKKTVDPLKNLDYIKPEEPISKEIAEEKTNLNITEHLNDEIAIQIHETNKSDELIVSSHAKNNEDKSSKSAKKITMLPKAIQEPSKSITSPNIDKPQEKPIAIGMNHLNTNKNLKISQKVPVTNDKKIPELSVNKKETELTKVNGKSPRALKSPKVDPKSPTVTKTSPLVQHKTRHTKTIPNNGTVLTHKILSKPIEIETPAAVPAFEINEKDIPVPKKILVKSLSKTIQKSPVSKVIVDLTEDVDDSDDDIPSPEFEVHTIDTKEKEFISELKKSILPELMKEIDSKIKKETSQLNDKTYKEPIKNFNESKTVAKPTNNNKPTSKSEDNTKSDDDISLDSFTEDALLKSDEETDDILDSLRLEAFEGIAEGRINDLDISRTDEASATKAENLKVIGESQSETESLVKTTTGVNRSSESERRRDVIKKHRKKYFYDNIEKEKQTSIKGDKNKIINLCQSKTSLEAFVNRSKGVTENCITMKPNKIDNKIFDKELVIPNSIVPKKGEEKPLLNGYVNKLKIKNIFTHPIVVKQVATNKEDKHVLLNGTHRSSDKTVMTNGDTDHIKDKEVISEPRPKRKLRSKIDRIEKNNSFNDVDFALYVEARQDAVMDENPELSKEDVMKYLRKTWMYEQETKSDRQKDDDIEQTNLVKGLITQRDPKPKRVKRKTTDSSEPVVRIERMNLTKKETKKDRIISNGITEDEGIDSDCEIVANGDLIDTISILSEKDSSTSEYVPSDDDDTSSLDIDDEVGLAKVKGEMRRETKEIVSTSNEQTSKGHRLAKMEEQKSAQDTSLKNADKIPQVKNEDLITPEDLDILEKKPNISDQVPVSPFSSPIKSDISDDSKPKRQQRVKTERNPNFPSVREVNSALDDPDFLKYLELRQDALLDENPHVSQDDLVKYLYKTWVYEQNLKTETEINDEIENSNLIKGLNDQPAQPKKIRKKVVKEVNLDKEFKIEKDVDVPPKDKSRRRATKQFYHEDDTDIEDELEVFEIFKRKNKTPKVEPNLKTEETTVTDVVKDKTDEPSKDESEEELDDIETYFLKLTQPKPNVFKGLAREKVCEICFKTGKLVKCKGLCGGTFHIDCVKNENQKIEEVVTPQSTRGRKKKKQRACPWLRQEGKKTDNLDDSQSDEKEINDEPLMVINADEFEAKLAEKMKEILNPDDIIEIDSSSDEEITWTETQPGKCEIIDVKLKIKEKNLENYDDFKCNNCQSNEIPLCFVCKGTKSPKNSVELRQKCQSAHCHKYYHIECLDHWPQTQLTEPNDSTVESLTCPRHVCHTCVSDDPRGCKTRFSGDKLAKCVKCPATYHSFTKCLPAGSTILSASHIICPRHFENRSGKVPCHVNAGWCFICALGGTLICCEYCPTSFHAECLQIKPPEGNYMCEDCETGRLPLYGEMVWVKLGHYRWWPGIVLHPSEVPDNIRIMKHQPGEFVVRFFGQYDHYWVNRGRVFPFQEGDSGRISSQKSKIDEAFTVAIEHASRAFEILKNAPPNEEEDTDIQASLLPPHYVKLRVNKPVGSLVNKKVEDLNSLTQCECDPRDVDPCGVDSQCLNRMLLTECGPLCAAGDRCSNRSFEKRLYPALAARRAPGRGWGLRALQDIAAGSFVIEYVGELVTEAESRRRMEARHAARDENFYFLTLDKDRVIDAGPKGNLARFMNHSCEPNCETQKWTVLGDVRVGLFALYDIPANSELTFNYNLECAGIEKKRCLCGAQRCSGYIGAKPKSKEEIQPKRAKPLQKRTYKKRKIEESPPIKKLGRPRTTMRSKPKELTEIEKDLLIIKNATSSAISSDSELSSRLNSVDNEEKKGLKRKRASFSSEDAVTNSCDSSPSVKKLKTDNSDSVSEKSDVVPSVELKEVKATDD